jgi:hypothetical protein
MFNQLFCRSDALTRQLSAPLVDEHRQRVNGEERFFLLFSIQ